MRIWLVDDSRNADLAATLNQTTELPGEGHVLVGVQRSGPCSADEMSARQIDALVIVDTAWPEACGLADLLESSMSALVATDGDSCGRFQALAQVHPIWFVPRQPTAETLRLALRGLDACVRRQNGWKTQLTALQQRLNDRVVIERAKGILVQRLGIGEEEAYQRLRLSSRRQRRQIRDIAQSLIDTQSLLLPEQNGSVHHSPNQRLELNEGAS